MTRFLEHQEYKIDKNIFYQDNESAIKMEKNGRDSAGSRSRHINIRYFFIKDILQKEHIIVKHCPTEIMIADFLTKPTQGTLFTNQRDVIMGQTPFPMKEHVEGQKSMKECCQKVVKFSNESHNKVDTKEDGKLFNCRILGIKTNDRHDSKLMDDKNHSLNSYPNGSVSGVREDLAKDRG